MTGNDTVVVLTYKSVETMIEEGGCGYWRANAHSLTTCKYVVATRNSRRSEREGEEEHGTAFMVGEINGVLQDGDRFVIQMKRFATLHKPQVWKAGGSNPVRYARLASLKIDPKTLAWETWPGEAADYADQPLTMEQAKTGLARTFGVRPDQIKITVEG